MEPTTPQPGRIPPIQTGIKAPPVVSKTSEMAQVAEDPKAMIVEKVTAGVTKHFSDHDNQNRYRRALKKARQTDRVPTGPQYRISLFEGGVVIGVASVVDLAEFIAGILFETGVGEIVNGIIDFIFASILTGYCIFRLKFTMAAHWQRYASIWGSFIGELIPFANSAIWILDAWYIVHSVRAEDKATYQQLIQTIEEDKQQEQRQQFMEDFARQQAEAAQDGEDEMKRINEQERREMEETAKIESKWK